MLNAKRTSRYRAVVLSEIPRAAFAAEALDVGTKVAAPPPQMLKRRTGCEENAAAALAEPSAEIEFLGKQKEALVEAADITKRVRAG